MIDVCLPTYLHSRFTTESLLAGKHVLCEKPMALTSAECDTMITASKKSGKKLMIAQCIRFWPEYAYIKQVITNKTFGKLTNIYCRRISPTPVWSYQNWLLNRKTSGGAIMDLHVHDIDYIVYLFGKPDRVKSHGVCNQSSKTSGVDYVITQYLYNNKTDVTVEGGWHYQPGFPFDMSFTARFEKATVVFNPALTKPFAVYKSNNTTEYPDILKSDGWNEEIKYFVDCIIDNKPVKISTPAESRLAVKLALAEEKSVKTNKEVTI
jgi:predicted dehydrogenase